MADEVEREHLSDVAVRYYRFSEHAEEGLAGIYVAFGSVVTGEAQWIGASDDLERLKGEVREALAEGSARRGVFERCSALIGRSWEQIEERVERYAIEQSEDVMTMLNYEDLRERLDGYSAARIRELRRQARENPTPHGPVVDFGGIHVRLKGDM